MTSEADRLGVDRRRLPDIVKSGAAFLVQFSGYLAGSFLKNLKAFGNQSCDLLMLVVRRKYDETPSRIAVSFKAEPGSSNSAVEKDKGATAKVMQSRCDISVLLKHKASQQHVFSGMERASSASSTRQKHCRSDKSNPRKTCCTP